MSRREEFERATAHARDAGREAKEGLVQTLARDFKNDPMSFDPKRLVPLDRAAIFELLQEVEVPKAARLLVTPVHQQIFNSGANECGWAHLRRSEKQHWLRALVVGVVIGTGINFIGLAGSMLLR
jgi:hypothetical protein